MWYMSCFTCLVGVAEYIRHDEKQAKDQQGLGKDVSHHIFCRKLKQLDDISLNHLSHEMTIQLNVFCPLMLNRIIG